MLPHKAFLILLCLRASLDRHFVYHCSHGLACEATEGGTVLSLSLIEYLTELHLSALRLSQKEVESTELLSGEPN